MSVSEGQPALTPADEERLRYLSVELLETETEVAALALGALSELAREREQAAEFQTVLERERQAWDQALAREREATKQAKAANVFYETVCYRKLDAAEGRVRDLQEERDAAERFATHDPRVDWPSDKHDGPMDAIMAAFDRLGEALVGLPER